VSFVSYHHGAQSRREVEIAEPDQNIAAAGDRGLHAKRVSTSNFDHSTAFPHSAVAAGIAWGGGDFSVAADNLRELTEEIAEISLASLEQTKQMIADVRDARHIDDLVAIQTRYLTSWFQTLAEQSQRLGSFFAAVPRDATLASRELVEASVEVAQDMTVVAASGLAATAVLSQSAPPERSVL
jgi:hypothetical protein